MFREVVWNEYCVLFPDGSHTPFNDEVRYTNLRGYLRKRRVVSDGGTEYALQYGGARRGWHRHYMYVNLKLLAWFEVDPEDPKGPTALQNLKLALSRGKGLGSVHLDSQECHLYVHRQHPNEFAVRFDQQLLQLQAASEEDARAWIVAIASCLYFCSSAFAELIEDCGRFFGAVPKSYDDGRLSVMEALDLLRAMGRETTLEQVEACAELTATGEKRFDAREFAFLVRYVCSEVEPAGELLRAFETFDPRGHNAVSADALVTQLINSGVPPEEIESVIRAAGPSAHGNIHYVRLVRALYPHSGGDVDELLRETGSTRGSVAESGPSQRTSVLLADQKKRQSIDKEKKLRASEASELQSHRRSITLQRANSSDPDFEPLAGGGPIAAAARAQLPGSAQCASAADGGEQLHRI